MLFAFAVFVLVVVGLGFGGMLVGVTPLAVIPVAFFLILAGVIVAMRIQERRRDIARERESFEFTEDDYRTLAHRPEHSHGDVKRGPSRPPGDSLT